MEINVVYSSIDEINDALKGIFTKAEIKGTIGEAQFKKKKKSFLKITFFGGENIFSWKKIGASLH